MRKKYAIPACIGLHLVGHSATLLAEPAVSERKLLNTTSVVVDDKEVVKNRVVEATFEREVPKAAIPGLSSPGAETKAVESNEVRTEFSSPDQNKRAFDIGSGYSNALGWVLWKTADTSLVEIANTTAFKDPDEGGTPVSVVRDPHTGKFRKITAAEYAEWGPKVRLGMYKHTPDSEDEYGSAVLMSVRDSFSYFNASQEGFGIDFTQQNGESDLKIKGAIMLDVYLDSLYNREGEQSGNTNPYRFWFRTGVEFDRDDSADQPTDRTSIYLLTNFQSNPNQAANLFGNKDLAQILSPQFLQLGVAYDHDETTGKDDMRWIIGWQPQFYVHEDKLKNILPEAFGINRDMFFEKGGFSRLLTPSEAFSSKEDKASNYYSSIPMDIRLSGGSEILAEAFDQDADSADEALLEWKAGLLFGHGPKLAKGQTTFRWRVGYFAEGASPVLDPAETHMGHRFVAEVGLGNLSQEYVDQQTANTKELKKAGFEFTALPTTAMGAMTLFAEYRFGAPPPSYTKDEMFLVGTRIRF